MRNLLTIATGICSLLAAVACDGGAAAYKPPPELIVTSPQRSLLRPEAGTLTVTGTATPNENGDPVEKVLVNDVQATVDASGAFTATIMVPAGATLIRTVARDANGGEASDTRAVHAGEQRDAGANIERAVTAAISTEAFAKIAGAAGPLIKGMNFGEMLAPLNPMVNKGGGPDCLYGQVFIDDVKFSDIAISLIPKAGGIAFRAQIENLDVPGRARYAAACLDGSNTVRVRASRVVVAGTLNIAPNGMAGFTTTLVSPDVQLTNLNIDASGLPGTIIDLLSLDTAIQGVIAKAAEKAMGPMMNTALGALGGPKQLEVLGKTLNIEVAPAAIEFDVTGGLVTLDMRMVIGGAEAAKFVFTENGTPAMDPGTGFQLGLADDLANEMLSEAQALGLLNISMPVEGGTFDQSSVSMTLPPMISADPADGTMRLVLGDMMTTFTHQGTPVGKAAMNATVALKIEPASNGYAVALNLGAPEIQVDVLDDIANDTRFTDDDLGNVVEACLTSQIASISKLLVAIPLPSVAGLQMRNLSVSSDDGYVVVSGSFD